MVYQVKVLRVIRAIRVIFDDYEGLQGLVSLGYIRVNHQSLPGSGQTLVYKKDCCLS